jgi:hypothetical protein
MIHLTYLKILIIGLCFGGLHSLPVIAANSIDATLYRSEVPVADRSANSRKKAFPTAALQVLRKLSANPEALANKSNIAKIRAQLSNINHSVQGYHYLEKASIIADSAPVLTLQVRFQVHFIDALLKKLGLTIWRKQRPQVLIWLAMPHAQTGQISVVNFEEAQDSRQALLDSAASQGLPITWGLLDLQDQQTLTANTFNQISAPAIKTLLQRYNADVLLLGTLSQANGTAQWQAHSAQYQLAWQSQQNNLKSHFNHAFQQLSQRLAANQRVLRNQSLSSLSINVQNILNMNDYAYLQRYVQRLDIVHNSAVESAHPNEIQMNLEVYGGQEQLDNILIQGGILHIQADNAQGIPVYRLKH